MGKPKFKKSIRKTLSDEFALDAKRRRRRRRKKKNVERESNIDVVESGIFCGRKRERERESKIFKIISFFIFDHISQFLLVI